MNKYFQSIKQWCILIVGLFVMAFGVAFSIKGDLGTSPISSLPYVTSQISGLTVGTTTIIMHCVLILLQVILLRDKFEWIQLLQLPIAFLFGAMTDIAINTVDCFLPANYLQQWLLCLIGIILVAIGVSFEVAANVATLAGEGFVLAVCKICPIKFGVMKIGFDVSLVTISCILSFHFLHGIYGVREGTLAAAFFVGFISGQINKHLVHKKNQLARYNAPQDDKHKINI